MAGPFFAPVRATFSRAIGPTLSDCDLLRAWSHVSTERLQSMMAADDALPPKKRQPEHVRATRRRLLALRFQLPEAA